MARFAFKGADEYALKLSKLQNTRPVAEKALKAGAGVVADKIRANANNILSKESTGDMMDSFGITPMDMDSKGNWNVKIGFDGYDRNGVPNQLKARVLNSGSSKVKKTRFVSKAVKSTKAEAQKLIGDTVDKEIKKIME